MAATEFAASVCKEIIARHHSCDTLCIDIDKDGQHLIPVIETRSTNYMEFIKLFNICSILISLVAIKSFRISDIFIKSLHKLFQKL